PSTLPGLAPAGPTSGRVTSSCMAASSTSAICSGRRNEWPALTQVEEIEGPTLAQGRRVAKRGPRDASLQVHTAARCPTRQRKCAIYGGHGAAVRVERPEHVARVVAHPTN